MLNSIALLGRLTGDPELKHTQNNKAVARFTLAVGRDFDREQTDFIDCVAWGKTAEFIYKWFRKGLLVAVTGRIQTRRWEDKQGQKRKSTEVVAEEAHFAEPKRAGGAGDMDSAGAAPDGFEEADGEELPF